MKPLFLLSIAALTATALAVSGEVVVAPIFSDNAVLQRDRKVPVWGTAAPGEEVTVDFAGQSVRTTANSGGKWLAELSPMTANAENRVLTVKGRDNTVEFKNILVGEVWICSGQSNMEFPMWGSRERFRQIDGDKIANGATNALIRIVKVPRMTARLPQIMPRQQWRPVTPESLRPFSAVGYFFIRDIQAKLGIPVGLIGSYWSGSRIEPFTPPEGFDSVPSLKSYAREVNAKLPGTPEYRKYSARVAADYADWLEKFKAASLSGAELPPPPVYPAELVPYDSAQKPTLKYNAMIYSLAPYAVRGVIWYQGCGNLGDGEIYSDKMQALFNGWKLVFKNPDLQFFFAQLAPFGYGGPRKHDAKLPVIWEAQQRFAEANAPAAGMAVINDVGDLGDIHPHDKTQVGRRLALLALKRTYNVKELAADSPQPVKSEVKDGKFVVKFANVGKFRVKDNAASPVGFEVAGADGVYYAASAAVNGAEITVWSDQVKAPAAVRYLWDQLAEATLWGAESSLPLGAFRIEPPQKSPEDMATALAASNRLVYKYDMKRSAPRDGGVVKYEIDNHAKIGAFKRVIYLVVARPESGEAQWVMAGMDAFTGDAGKIGVPTQAAGAVFQTRVNNLVVRGNAPGVTGGDFLDGNIEFFPNNYSTKAMLGLPDASSQLNDFDDKITAPERVGYGSMQLHNYRLKQTIFAYNNFRLPGAQDFGFGNSTGKHPDWTFSKNIKSFKSVTLYVFVSEK